MPLTPGGSAGSGLARRADGEPASARSATPRRKGRTRPRPGAARWARAGTRSARLPCRRARGARPSPGRSGTRATRRAEAPPTKVGGGRAARRRRVAAAAAAVRQPGLGRQRAEVVVVVAVTGRGGGGDGRDARVVDARNPGDGGAGRRGPLLQHRTIGAEVDAAARRVVAQAQRPVRRVHRADSGGVEGDGEASLPIVGHQRVAIRGAGLGFLDEHSHAAAAPLGHRRAVRAHAHRDAPAADARRRDALPGAARVSNLEVLGGRRHRRRRRRKRLAKLAGAALALSWGRAQRRRAPPRASTSASTSCSEFRSPASLSSNRRRASSSDAARSRG